MRSGELSARRQVSKNLKCLNQYQVVLEVAPKTRKIRGLKYISVRRHREARAVSSFAHYEHSKHRAFVNHKGIFTAITLSSKPAQGASLGRRWNTSSRRVAIGGRTGACFRTGKQRRPLTDSLQDQAPSVPPRRGVYIVSGILYAASFTRTILSPIPSAGIGALLALQVMKMDLSILRYRTHQLSAS